MAMQQATPLLALLRRLEAQNIWRMSYNMWPGSADMSTAAAAAAPPQPHYALPAAAGLPLVSAVQVEWFDDSSVNAQQALRLLVHRIQQEGPVSESLGDWVPRAGLPLPAPEAVQVPQPLFSPAPVSAVPLALCTDTPAPAVPSPFPPSPSASPLLFLPLLLPPPCACGLPPLQQSSATCRSCTNAARPPRSLTRR